MSLSVEMRGKRQTSPLISFIWNHFIVVCWFSKTDCNSYGWRPLAHFGFYKDVPHGSHSTVKCEKELMSHWIYMHSLCFNVSTAVLLQLSHCNYWQYFQFFWFCSLFIISYTPIILSSCKLWMKLWKSCVSVKCCDVGLYAVIFMFVTCRPSSRIAD